MIEHVDIQYFRCVRSARLDLGPLTVLVGPNGSGKSTLLDSMRSGRVGRQDQWRNAGQPAEIKVRFTNGNSGYRNEGSEHLGFRAQTLRLTPTALRSQSSASKEAALNESGSNVANVLFSLGREKGRRFSEEFCRLVPVYADVDVDPVGNGGIQLRFEDRWQRGLLYTPQQVSDGTLLVAGFLAAARQLVPPELLLVEDPEQGLHPWLIGQIVALLRSLAHPDDPGVKPVQVVVATHSPELLDHLRPEEVRFVDRSADDGATTVTAASTDNEAWPAAFAAYRERLSDVWLSGAFGGVPGR